MLFSYHNQNFLLHSKDHALLQAGIPVRPFFLIQYSEYDKKYDKFNNNEFVLL